MLLKEKRGYYIILKGSLQEEAITIITIYAPNLGRPQYVRKMLTNMKGEINSNTYDQLDRKLARKHKV